MRRLRTGLPLVLADSTKFCEGDFRGTVFTSSTGNPGTGKTTLALQFLIEGARNHEPVLYVTLSETRDELADVAKSHNLSLDGITIYDLALPANDVRDSEYTLFHPSEIELGETTKAIFHEVERVHPTRVVFDSLSEMRLLAGDPLRYRRQILALKHFFVGRACTVLLLDDNTSLESDRQLESLAHGVVLLEQQFPKYGRPDANCECSSFEVLISRAAITISESIQAGSRSIQGWSQRIIRRTLNQKSSPAASPNSML